MKNYYSKKLSGARLKKCYQIAPPRVAQYLKAEIDFAKKKIKSSDNILELGCGYGRILKHLSKKASEVTGIDTSLESLKMAKDELDHLKNIHLGQMNASNLGVKNGHYDGVLCLQNGLSAFNESPDNVFAEIMRVVREGGWILLSSYSELFWEDRLDWFKIQSRHGLIGAIDYQKTGNGLIVGKDGFRATTFCSDDFSNLTVPYQLKPKIFEIDSSSLFCEIHIPELKK